MSERPEDRWQAHITSLKQGILKIYENKAFYNVEFKIRGQNSFKGHSLVLSARSPVFARMLLNNLGHKEFNITDEFITETGFKTLLCFIYTDTMDIENKKEIIEAYVAAAHYQQSALMAECNRRIDSWTITKDDVWEMLDTGLNLPKLKKTCIDFIKNEPNEALSSPSFLKISFKCVTVILLEDVLNNVPPFERIRKIMEWAAACPAYKSGEKVDYSLVRASFLGNKLEKKPCLLTKLGFNTMNSGELQKTITTYRRLLTDTEVREFLEYFEYEDESLLPEWSRPVPTV